MPTTATYERHATSRPATRQADGDPGLSREVIDLLLREHTHQVLPRLDRLWDYYRNDLTEQSDTSAAVGGREYRLAQQRGLPARLTNPPPTADGQARQREIVIENDIAWRIHALVDFTFGKPFTLQSLAPDRHRADLIETFLRHVLDANGGIGLFQDLALLGAVYGHADILLRTDAVRPIARTTALPIPDSGPRTPDSPLRGSVPAQAAPPLPSPGFTPGGAASSIDPASRQMIIERAKQFVLEIIEAPRAVPVLHPSDYRRLDGYLIHYRQVVNRAEDIGLYDRLRDHVLGRTLRPAKRAELECTEVWTATQQRQYLRDAGQTSSRGEPRLVEERDNPLGRIPIVHIQNLPQPFFYDGLSEVEPLIPLQDELNIRLSDRANRVTFQSFKMYLGKGIEGFLERPVGPGQMWATDNLEASIQQFGGDAANPSEDAHILEIREALDKTSGVTPVAAGVIRDRIGNLTSENALRVTLIGMLSRTEKKRQTYGAGIERLCELILHAADMLGVLPNGEDERQVRLDWPSPLPESDTQRLHDAKLKLDLGVPRRQILAELGYDECPAE